MVKTIQKMKKVSLSFPERPKKTDKDCCNNNGDPDPDTFDMAVFAWNVEGRLQVNETEDGQVQG
jgi:hypothetical protein